MKKILLLLKAVLFFGICIAQETKEKILLYPESWSYERIDFPLSFAPEIKYTGFEELRFSSGMFDKTSDLHFTYVILMNINESVKLKEDDVNLMFENYFKGLCTSMSKDKTIDTTLIKAELEKVRKNHFKGKCLVIDVFNDFESVSLNMDVKIYKQKDKSTKILFLISKQDFDMDIWTEMKNLEYKLNLKKLYY